MLGIGRGRQTPEKLHRKLNTFNRTRLSPSLDAASWDGGLGGELKLRHAEYRFVEAERACVHGWAATAPMEPEAFLTWFEALKQEGPGQNDALFPWLAEQASYEEMRWFLRQEMSGEAGFDDLVALTQVKLPVRAKLELARNYWDEMGQGHAGGMHGPLLARLGEELDFDDDSEIVWESLALGNLMVALALNRHYTYQSIGALGVIEMTAPWRSAHVNAGLKRLGFDGAARRYYALHATLDLKHSLAWNSEVIAPLVSAEPRAAFAIAEGALLRLRAGARCFERYRRELTGSSRSGQIAEPLQQCAILADEAVADIGPIAHVG
jgi:hypothetical protein